MKKILILSLSLIVALNTVSAKDYTKLQVKEMKQAQKYNTTKNLVPKSISTNVTYNAAIKDPKIMKFGDYDHISKTKYESKLKSDEKKYEEYQKELGKSASKHYKTQADARDFYTIYRIAEKIIRANNLDYINWRFEIYKDTVSLNAFTANTNHVALSTSMIDTYAENEDALAFVIGHEMGHALLGHQKRLAKAKTGLKSNYEAYSKSNDILTGLIVLAQAQKYTTESKHMEYAADVEGAKLAKRAGYNIEAAYDVMSFFETHHRGSEFLNTHPDPVNRMENLKENIKYFPDEWADMGRTNIYNSEPLPARLSSDRKSMVISAPAEKLDSDKYYSPEKMEELYARLGYMCYINGEFSKSSKYFQELFALDTTNAPAYLYASYANEYLYKNTENKKYLKLAKEYAQKAYDLDSKNKYIKEQVDSL